MENIVARSAQLNRRPCTDACCGDTIDKGPIAQKCLKLLSRVKNETVEMVPLVVSKIIECAAEAVNINRSLYIAQVYGFSSALIIHFKSSVRGN